MSHLSRGHVPSVLRTFCPDLCEFPHKSAQTSRVSLGRPEFIPGTLPGHSDHQMFYVIFHYCFFSSPNKVRRERYLGNLVSCDLHAGTSFKHGQQVTVCFKIMTYINQCKTMNLRNDYNPKGPSRTKNTTAPESVVCCYRCSFSLSVPIFLSVLPRKPSMSEPSP